MLSGFIKETVTSIKALPPFPYHFSEKGSILCAGHNYPPSKAIYLSKAIHFV